MKLYLAGPMRGIPHFNFPAFNAAAAVLRAEGHEVFNPAEKDCERHKHDISADNHSGSEQDLDKKFGYPPGGFLRMALGEDLAWICAEAEGIVLLPGWESSKGACAEYYTAKALGLAVRGV